MSAIGSVILVLSWHSGTGHPAPGTLFLGYQLLLVTPATSPVRASSRKHKRHNANLRIYARGRPHWRQRLRCRTLNFRVFLSRAFFAVVATVAPKTVPFPVPGS